jgi:hypothetical protein
MNIFTNAKLIKRNAIIAQVAIFGGLAVLAGGMFISFTRPAEMNLSLIALLLGFFLSQVGIYFSNRYGRRPRPDELLNQALKGLDGKYSLYHYLAPASHLLVGPSGVWVLLPKHQRGKITYSKGRWRQQGGNILSFYLRLFAQEGLGRPEMEVQNEVESMHSFLVKRLPEGVNPPEIQVALVFTNPQSQIEIEENESPPAETVPLPKLKDLIRKSAKGKALSAERAKQIQDLLNPQ